MKKFHDVKIYAGREVATTASRLELAANNLFLRKIFSEMNFCEGCREPVVIIFPDEDKSTLREAFDKLSQFKSGLSIIENPEKVNSLLARLRLPSSGLATPSATRDRSSRRTQSDSEPGEVTSVERSSNHQEEDGQGSGDRLGPGSNDRQVEAEVENTEMREFFNAESDSDLVMTSVETCLENDENREVLRREVTVDLEKVDVSQLRISPEVPPASGHERLTLVKRAASGSVYKIFNKKEKKSSKKSDLVKKSSKPKPKVALENILPTHLRIPKISNGVRERKKSLKKVAPGEKYLTKKSQREIIPESNQKVKNCHLCPYQNTMRSQMYIHYSLYHYRENLAQHIDQNTMECPYCEMKKNKIYKGEQALIMHIGSAHNKIENYLPVEFHLPRSIRGNFLNVPSTTGPVEETMEDQDQHKDQGEKSSPQISLEADSSPETVKDLDKTIEKDSENSDENNKELMAKEDGESLRQNLPEEDGEEVGGKTPVWTVSERESFFDFSDSDDE